MPRCLVPWHRKGFKLYWRWKSRGGLPALSEDIRQLIGHMVMEWERACEDDRRMERQQDCCANRPLPHRTKFGRPARMRPGDLRPCPNTAVPAGVLPGQTVPDRTIGILGVDYLELNSHDSYE